LLRTACAVSARAVAAWFHCSEEPSRSKRWSIEYMVAVVLVLASSHICPGRGAAPELAEVSRRARSTEARAVLSAAKRAATVGKRASGWPKAAQTLASKLAR
jgi:hypothetical protein